MPTPQTFPLATKDQAMEIWQEASDWFYSAPPIWADAKFAAKSSVAEYLANQKGLTLYESRVQK